jgi:hypothetical protein
MGRLGRNTKWADQTFVMSGQLFTATSSGQLLQAVSCCCCAPSHCQSLCCFPDPSPFPLLAFNQWKCAKLYAHMAELFGRPSPSPSPRTSLKSESESDEMAGSEELCHMVNLSAIPQYWILFGATRPGKLLKGSLVKTGPLLTQKIHFSIHLHARQRHELHE